MSAPRERWDRLNATLADAGITAAVTSKKYAGRTSYNIIIRIEGAVIVVHDGYWHDMWTGWSVYREDLATGFSTQAGRRMKTRNEVLAAVRAARGDAVTA